MKDFKLLFKSEAVNENFDDDTMYYYLWSVLDIGIGGNSFFRNFKDEFYEETGDYMEGVMTGSTISSKGMTVPSLYIIESIIKVLQKLKDEKECIIEDPSGQIGKEIVCNLIGDQVIFAVRQRGCTFIEKDLWYDGEGLSSMKNIPISTMNNVEFESFITGCIVGINEYIEKLVEEPALADSSIIKGIKKNLLKIDNK